MLQKFRKVAVTTVTAWIAFAFLLGMLSVAPSGAQAVGLQQVAGPEVTISAPANNTIFAVNNVTVFWNATDTTGIINRTVYQLDNGVSTAINGTGPYNHTFALLADGAHSVKITAFNQTGGNGSGTVSFKVDTTGPTIKFVTPTANQFLNITTVLGNWTVADAVSGVATIYVKLDNAADYTYIMLNSTQLFTGLSEGAHTITIRAVDNVDNERVASQTFTIDLTPPTIVSTSPTGVNIAVSPGAIKVSFSEKMLRNSAKITINGNATIAPNPQWSNGDKNATWTLASFAYAKNYTITVTAQDLAGNRLTGARTFSFSTICQIVGNIDDQMGNSITGARVTLMRNGLAIANATTDPNGNFNFAVAPGNYSIEVSKSDYNSLSGSLTVALGVRNSFGILTLTLAPNYSLPITLLVVIIVVVGAHFVLSRRKK